MVMMRVLCVVVIASLAACWRGTPTRDVTLGAQDPISFVARVNGLGELERKSDALERRLATAKHRILRLATESERVAIRDSLDAVAEEVAQLEVTARVARTRGDDRAVLDKIDRQLAEATAMLDKLGEGLIYANTIADLQALETQPTDFRRAYANGRIGIDDFGP